MKKFLLILMIALSAIQTFASTETKVSEEVLTVVTEVCDRLQVPAEKVWTITLSSQVLKGVTDLVYCLIISIMFIVFFKKAIKEYSIDGESFKSYFFLSGTILLGATVFACIYVSYEAIIQIINPEYRALNEVVSVIKSLQ